MESKSTNLHTLERGGDGDSELQGHCRMNSRIIMKHLSYGCRRKELDATMMKTSFQLMWECKGRQWQDANRRLM